MLTSFWPCLDRTYRQWRQRGATTPFLQPLTHIFGSSFVADKQDTLIEQSLTLIEQTCMVYLFFSKPQVATKFITRNIGKLDLRACKILTEGYAPEPSNSKLAPSFMACSITYDSYSSSTTGWNSSSWLPQAITIDIILSYITLDNLSVVSSCITE